MNYAQRIKDIRISIHALRGEGDFKAHKEQIKHLNFNPRPPWGGRQQLKV